MSRMSKRAPYLEVFMTLAAMAFLALIIAGGFNQGPNDVAQATHAP